MRAALIRDGVVENIIEVDPGYDPDEGYDLVHLDDTQAVSPGWTYTDGEFTAPNGSPAPTDPTLTVEELATQVAEQQDVIDFLVAFVTAPEGETL